MRKILLGLFIFAVFSIQSAAVSAQNPFFASSKPQKTFTIPTPAPVEKFLQKIFRLQQQYIDYLTNLARKIKDGTPPGNFWPLMNLAFLYGVVHALGPGHGKMNQEQISLSVLNPADWTTRFIGNLSAAGASFGWDSRNNRLLLVDSSGDLQLIHLSDGAVENIRLLPQKTAERVFFSKIWFSGQGPDFRLILLTYDPQGSNQSKKYNVRWYAINSTTKKSVLIGTLKSRTYKDIIASCSDRSLLVRNYDNGLYRKTDGRLRRF
jgi:hypothetical protein